jgi:hypothetical protein
MRKRRIIRIALIALVLLVAGAFSLRWFLSSARLRKNWKDQGVPAVAHWADDSHWLDEHIGPIKAQLAQQPPSWGAWVGDHVLLMKNGDWIVFQNDCSHQQQLLRDIFIGKGSDGRWYYSSFHFCCDAIVLKIEAQPPDLTAFVQKYFLREFDGKSDDAIKPTWTVGSGPVF